MRVRILKSTLVGAVNHVAGDFAEVHDQVGKRLIKFGFAAADVGQFRAAVATADDPSHADAESADASPGKRRKV